MNVRAKFVCNWKQLNAAGQGQQITFSPVYSGSEENKQFFASTPGGSIQLYTTNPAAAAAFEQGKEYFVDFTPAADGKEVKHSKRHLRCELTDAELLQSGKELANRSAELVALENEKARIVSDFAARIKGKEADIAILTSTIQTRCEYRSVQCAEMLDTPEPGKKTINRTDTGETIAVEEMSASEMQREFAGVSITTESGGARKTIVLDKQFVENCDKLIAEKRAK